MRLRGEGGTLEGRAGGVKLAVGAERVLRVNAGRLGDARVGAET